MKALSDFFLFLINLRLKAECVKHLPTLKQLGPHEYALEHYLTTKVVTFQADMKEILCFDNNSDVDFAFHCMDFLMRR